MKSKIEIQDNIAECHRMVQLHLLMISPTHPPVIRESIERSLWYWIDNQALLIGESEKTEPT